MAGPNTPLMAGELELAAGPVGPAVRSEARLPPPSRARSSPIGFDPPLAVRKGRCLIPRPTAASLDLRTFSGNLLSSEDTYTMIRDMSGDEIPQVDRCEEGGLEHHRLRGIVLAFAGNRRA